MKQVLKEAADTAKKLPKVAWVAAVVIPGGFTVIALYTAIKVYSNRSKNDRRKNRS